MKIVSTFVLVLVVTIGNAQAGVDLYLQKYQGVRASQSQQDRLLQYDHLIEYFCSLPFFSNGIEIHPDFLRALILVESNGDPLAISSKNARGLTQIIYSTGKEVAAEITRNSAVDVEQMGYVTKAQLEYLSPEALHDPAVNIVLACYLIAKYNQAYQGHLDLVVSAWNAGPGAIVNNQPPEYEETLDLIGKVNGLFRYFIERSM
ncbi:lytic transglycosylase domain-containing protein [Desulfopila aestuarii]|uniref:Transglycosylase SLT domain-containing protein n=1 Tax=Desulfopila aestuarii DSM 18488 TaxID=1121416 RepID=A0A1M7YHK4_9BACT|nr:lytic transglycosylase domain-containing protein [Desulfopila aestuarii]SHO52083.1 Transglycosylase SLT domain-containing protein [Desulfopila aestuarii DSM 18488]